MKSGTLFLLYTALLCVAGPAFAAGLTKAYSMAFHACNATTSTTYCGNPAEHTTHIAESDDGATWTQIPGFYSGWAGSVPDLVIRGTTIYVYNPSTVTRINKGSGGLVS